MTNEELLAQNKAQAEQISILKHQLTELKKLIFGSKSERFIPEMSPEQLNLFSEDIPKVQAIEGKEKITFQAEKKKKHFGRNELPENLPVEEIIIEPQGDLTGMKRIGEDVTETVEYIAGSLKIIRTIRYRYVKVDENGVQSIIQAPSRSRPFPKCIAENSLLAYIIISKFIEHLPFYRQIQRFKRDYDWNLSKNTINDWFIAVCTLLVPLYDTMVRKLLESEYIQADESHIKVQDGTKKGSTHQGYQWVYHAPLAGIVVFKYRKGRGLNGPKEFLENYEGFLQCDGYSVYDKIGKHPKIHLVGCHVHARRYFVKAKDAGDTRANFVLEQYQKIYQHERHCHQMEPKNRKEYRDEHTKPLFDQLKTWLDEQAITVLPKSPLGNAIRYTIGQWPKLMAVLKDGQLEMDNNLIENKIRPLALGRKNYLFAGNHNAAQRIAMMYTFFATCKANDINPQQWLKHTLDIIADHKVNELELLIPHKGMFDVSDVI